MQVYNINFKNKRVLSIIVGIGLILFICIVVPFLREKYLYWRLGYVDIASILIQDSDLPVGFKKGSITAIDPYYYEWVQANSQSILASNGSEIGTVSVYLFASSSEQSEMYEIYSHVESQEGIIPYEVTNIGEQSTVFSISGCDIQVLFIRCTAVAVIELYNVCQEEYDFDKLVSHAKRLDESLKSIACY